MLIIISPTVIITIRVIRTISLCYFSIYQIILLISRIRWLINRNIRARSKLYLILSDIRHHHLSLPHEQILQIRNNHIHDKLFHTFPRSCRYRKVDSLCLHGYFTCKLISITMYDTICRTSFKRCRRIKILIFIRMIFLFLYNTSLRYILNSHILIKGSRDLYLL